MKAIVIKEIGEVTVEACEEPRITNAGDAIVRVTTGAVCGSDLHIVHGRDKGVRMGTIMGHEFVGVIEETGDGVSGFRKGDRVVSPFTINCGDCFFCLKGLPARCILSLCFGFVTESGEGLQGAQAEFVRVPLASSTLVKIPQQLADEEVIFLGDIFSTAYSCVENALIQKGDVVVVIGCGPVGLLSVLSASLFDPEVVVAVDSIGYRLEKARSFGALTVQPEPEIVRKVVMDLSRGRGADAVIEAVGHPAALDLAIDLARPGAAISIAGYHTTTSYAFPIHVAYQKNLSLRIGRCNARKYISKLLPLVQEKRLPLMNVITHVLPLTDGRHGYRIFDQKQESAIKVLLKP